MKLLKDYNDVKYKWITTLESVFYPDYLAEAKLFYEPVIIRFGELAGKSASSEELFLKISDEPPEIRIQLLRVFRKYVSPNTSVEMLKVKGNAKRILENFGQQFRDIDGVVEKFLNRPEGDEVLAGILHEYQDRGSKGYILTGRFFDWFEKKFSTERVVATGNEISEQKLLPDTKTNSSKFHLSGPIGAGKDIILDSVLQGYPKKTPVDFIIWDKEENPLVIGFARYDSDRGGAQEDDRIKGYSDNITDILNYAKNTKRRLKVLLLNEGPGLLLGSMWNDYSALEVRNNGLVMVVTLKMLDERLTEEWILS